MRKVILRSKNYLSPFNEAARDLRIQNKPLWLHQRDLLARYVPRELISNEVRVVARVVNGQVMAP